jgi:ubiquinone/menaquinone biosynthesis C-methylase UbiE
MSATDDARGWQRYWRWVRWADPSATSPFDAYTNRLLALVPGKRWLDAGCGRASLPRWRRDEGIGLRGTGTTFFGCDVDVLALREREDSTLVCAATLERLPFRDRSFEVVTANMVFEHLTEPEGAVAELARVTAPGGRILVHTVNGRHWLAWVARLTPHAFHQWIVERLEGRFSKDVYPTQYRANTVPRLRELFERNGCHLAGGDEIPGLPLYVPYPFLFWIALGAGMGERWLARFPTLSPLLNANLLVEFERSSR